LVINVDPDVIAGSAGGATGLKKQDVEHWANTFDPKAAENADGEIELDGGVTKVALVRWEVNDPAATPGLPDQQTLERLVCSALVAAYPPRAKAVQDWLNARPNALTRQSLTPRNMPGRTWQVGTLSTTVTSFMKTSGVIRRSCPNWNRVSVWSEPGKSWK
jgi:hypothetical protein